MTTKRERILLVFLFAGCVLLCGSGQVKATIYEVPTNYATLQEAVDVAISGDVINVLAGTYVEPGNKNITILDKDISIIAVSGPDATEIDCGNDGRGFFFDNSNGLLEGFTINHGGIMAGGYDGGERGGGIYCDNGSDPTIRNCVVQNCRVQERGGGLYCTGDSSPILESCTIRNCLSNNNGGGMACDNDSAPVFEDCLILDNETPDLGGGAWAVNRAYPKFNRCVFKGNSAKYGGALRLYDDARADLTECFLVQNEATRQGGAIHCRNNSRADLMSCTVADNSGGNLGGGIYVSVGIVDLKQTIVWGNTAATNGNEVLLSGSNATAFLECSCTLVTVEGGTVIDNGGNVYEDPQFCMLAMDEDDPHYYYGLHYESPCNHLHNPGCSEMIGAAHIRCHEDPPVGTEHETWGGVKALYR